MVIQTVDSNGGTSRVIAVDRVSGQLRWEAPRPLFSASWSTPVICRHGDEIPKDYRVVQRPELPEGHPGRHLPWPLRGMLGGMDKNEDGKVTAEEWAGGLAKFESMDRPVLMALRPGVRPESGPARVAWSHGRVI